MLISPETQSKGSWLKSRFFLKELKFTLLEIVIKGSPVFPFFVKKNTKIYVDVARMPKGQIFLYKFADRLRVNTHAVKKNIIKEVSSSLAKKIKVIPPSIPFKPQLNITPKDKKKLIVYLGRIHEEKGIEIFIKALKEINLDNWKVRIIGPWKIRDGGSGKDYRNFLVNQLKGKPVFIEEPISSKNIFKLEHLWSPDANEIEKLIKKYSNYNFGFF